MESLYIELFKCQFMAKNEPTENITVHVVQKKDFLKIF